MSTEVAPDRPPVAEPPASLPPVSAGERVAAIDVLRGFALLGILAVNIWSFALPSAVFYDPSAAGGFTGWNFAAWLVSHVLFEQKMMSIFSMLFGAGLVILTARADARGLPLTRIYYRRILWLLVFGLVHAYALWEGDILVAYALCGLALYPLRRLAPARQAALGLGVFLLAVPISAGSGLLLQWGLRADEHSPAAGGWRRVVQRQVGQAAEEILATATPEGMQEEIDTARGSYAELFRARAAENLWLETVEFIIWAGPRAGGLMLLGMALMKLGVFTGALPTRVYAALAISGYGLGLPVVAYGVSDMMRHDFDIFYTLIWGGQFNYVGSLFVALGHVGVVMLLVRAGWLPALTSRLAAVGRMALTNYLLQTVICTALFDGWGLGLFARLDRVQLVGVVAAVWAFQLAVSPLWLRAFRFGPAEWLWRSLTYRRRQPFLAAGAADGPVPAGNCAIPGQQ
jgi:uncharacterized protein